MQLKDFIYESKQNRKESKWPEADKFLDYVEEEFRKNFPNGYYEAKAYNGLGSPTINVRFGIGYASNGIKENDNMYHSFMIHTSRDAEDFSGELEFSSLQGGINTQPDPDTHYAMARVKTKLTNVKKNGSLAKFEKKMKAFFPKLKKLMQDNQDNLYSGQEGKTVEDRMILRKDLRV